MARDVQDKCRFCEHSSMMPFYSAFKYKKKRGQDITELQCPKCKKGMGLGSDTSFNFTTEESAARQIGQPSLCCEVPYKYATIYYDIRVCKRCNKAQ